MNHRSRRLLEALIEAAEGSTHEEDFAAKGGTHRPIGPSREAVAAAPAQEPAKKTPFHNNIWTKGGVVKAEPAPQNGAAVEAAPKSFMKSIKDIKSLPKPKARHGSTLTPGRWLAGGAIGAAGGILLGGMVGGGPLTPVLAAVAGFLAGTGAAHRTS